MTPADILHSLATQDAVRTPDLPQRQRGIYGLINHEGELRYIGSTSRAAENFHKRIHQRHRTGSETHSHYFSKVYCCGRMWRDPFDRSNVADAKVAKAVRNEFIAAYCGAVYVPIPGNEATIQLLEAEVIRIAPTRFKAWNGRTDLVYQEPVNLLDKLLDARGYGEAIREALARQAARERAKR
ncbi:GIY-YIG nuclease family protein [Mesorhizobium sp. ESP6-5]|uniref:GIY-YIG nuclease family protein n=1 Tax=Mesorhizobium sp. ESP6-5 TaxID=2876623 RepID=UPI001CC90742|nr:GIY-YIG nuclease family protein [Mesorhizobium sp. ESP6-5]MBZ9755258.1 GIY-YIG nuclease family protein [Mesorhizobium sp. ESP6-5]